MRSEYASVPEAPRVPDAGLDSVGGSPVRGVGTAMPAARSVGRTARPEDLGPALSVGDDGLASPLVREEEASAITSPDAVA